MSICREVAGFSFGHADIVRRAMAKKKADLLNAERDAFIRGATKKNIDKKLAGELFDELTSFANYAFNKSHATAYAIISYQTAYLKAHYPTEYMAALLTSVQDNLTKLSEYIVECSKLGIKVLPPDVNASGVYFTPNGNDIVFGLQALKNVGKQFVENIITERRIRPFKSFEDFLKRMSEYDINRRMVETLIKSGAFDNLGVYRSQLLNSYENLINILAEKNRNNISGQLDMFSLPIQGGDASNEPEFKYPNIEEFSLKELLMLEKESSGMYFSGHPIESYTEHASYLGLDNLSILYDEDRLLERKAIKISAMLTSISVKTTKKNDKMAFINVEDRFGEIECILFSDKYTKFMHHLRIDAPLMIEGSISIRDDEAPRIIVSNIDELIENNNFKEQKINATSNTHVKQNSGQPQTKPSANMQKIYLKVPDMECEKYLKVLNLVNIFEGVTKVIFYDSSTKKYISYSNGLSVTDFVLKELYSLLGQDNVVLK